MKLQPSKAADEILESARAERNRRLQETDWIELPRRRSQKSPTFVEAMDAYRDRCREVVTDVKNGLPPVWPSIPVEV